jgi:catechol 2,3-dioxygenase-like lactoylglutathione lyase family enzyme
MIFSMGCKKMDQKQQSGSQVLSINANLVFLYYSDLPRAQHFYEDILGLERVLDYGFASIHRISETSYVGLVDENEGMHKASEPKTVTLAFVTDEVDGWYDYLKGKGVEMKGPARDATRHPTRGFVAFDPEGYYLEFERFLEHPQNEKLLAKLEDKKSLYPTDGQTTSRPENQGVKANVIWLYYNDLKEAQRFYEETFGFRFLVDQGFAKVYSSSPTGFIGLVDQAQGLHRFTEEKAVTVSFITPKVDEWYDHLMNKKIEIRSPLDDSEGGLVRAFVAFDIAGYYLEFDWFYEHEKNDEILRLLME